MIEKEYKGIKYDIPVYIKHILFVVGIIIMLIFAAIYVTQDIQELSVLFAAGCISIWIYSLIYSMSDLGE